MSTADQPKVVTDALSDSLKETTRLEAFSDGVFAIAITLLVLEIRLPELEENQSLINGLLEHWTVYLAYVSSFLTIGVMWLNHHALFKLIRRTDNVFILLNIVLLMLITFVNFPTILIAEYLEDVNESRTAVLIYGGTFIVIAIAFNLLWRYASYKDRLLSDTADQALVQSIHRQYLFGPLFYVVTTLLTFVSVWASLAAHVALAIFFALTGNNSAQEQ